jgi:hypothetical protein
VPRTLAEVVTAAVEAQRSELEALVRQAVDVELERLLGELVDPLTSRTNVFSRPEGP